VRKPFPMHHRQIPAGLALFLVLMGLSESVRAGIDEKVADNLMNQCGLWEQVDALAPKIESSLKDALSRSSASLPAGDQERLLKGGAEAFARGRLRSAAAAQIAAEIDHEDASIVAAWCDGPTGQRIRSLSAAGAAPSMDQAKKLRAGNEAYARLGAKRQGDLWLLANAAQTGDFLADIAIETTVAAARAVAFVSVDPHGPSPDELRVMMESQRSEIARKFGEIVVAGWALDFATLNDADVDAYQSFLASPAGMRFNRAAREAIRGSFVKASRALTDQLATNSSRPGK